MRALNALAGMAGAILCVVALLVLGGCTMTAHHDPALGTAFGAFAGTTLALSVVCLMFGGWAHGRPLVTAFLLVTVVFIAGCAALPV